jgi:PII-like signaling protein
MDIPREAVLLRIFAAETDRAAGRGLYRAVVLEARKTGLAGATVFQGPLSFGRGCQVNSKLNVDAPQHLPVVVEIIDAEERIDAFLPKLDGLIDSGLVTLETARATRAGRRTKPGPCAPGEVVGPGSSAEGTPKEGVAMELPHDAVLLRIFTSVDDRCGVEEPLYHAIVMKAREMHLGGATVLKGILGYGRSNRLHQPHLLAADDRPVVIEICDAEDKINAFLPVLDQIMESGLITLEKAKVVHYGRQRSGYLDRIKDSLRAHRHRESPP